MADRTPRDIHKQEQTQEAAREIARWISCLVRAFLEEGWPHEVAVDLAMRTMRNSSPPPEE